MVRYRFLLPLFLATAVYAQESVVVTNTSANPVPITGSISVTATAGPLQVTDVNGSTQTVGFQSGAQSVPVSFPGSGLNSYVTNPTTTTVSNLFAGTTVYLVNPATVTVNNLYSGTTVYVVNPATVTVSNLYAGTTFYLVNPATVTVSNLYTGTTVYVVNPSTVTQGPAGVSFWGVDHSTGVQVNGTVTANAGTPNARFPGTDLSTGVVANQGTPAARSWGVDLSTGVKANQGVPGSAFWPIDLSTGVRVVPGPVFLGVDFSSGVAVKTPTIFLGVDHSTGVQVNTGGRFLGVDVSTGIQVNGKVANNATEAGNPLPFGVQVASSAFPNTNTANGNILYATGDTLGRIATTGVPWGMIQSSYSAVISTAIYGTGGPTGVLISSPGANTSAYLCGCILSNTTATGALVRFASPVNATAITTTSRVMDAWVTANTGASTQIGFDCSTPIFKSSPNTSTSLISVTATGAVPLAASVYCMWYVAP